MRKLTKMWNVIFCCHFHLLPMLAKVWPDRLIMVAANSLEKIDRNVTDVILSYLLWCLTFWEMTGYLSTYFPQPLLKLDLSWYMFLTKMWNVIFCCHFHLLSMLAKVWEMTDSYIYLSSIIWSKLDQLLEVLKKFKNVKCHTFSPSFNSDWGLRNDRLIGLAVLVSKLLQLLKVLRKLTKMWNVIFCCHFHLLSMLAKVWEMTDSYI